MIEPNITDIESTGVNAILKVNHRNLRGEFKIPIYQRPYTWTKDNVNQLFIDFIEHSESNSNMAYYLGQFVFVKQDNEQAISILDGQQRITTLYIFVIALKNFLAYLIDKINSHGNLASDDKKDFIKEINGTEHTDGLIDHLNSLIFKDDNQNGRLLMSYPDDNEHFKFLLKNRSIIDLDEKIRESTGDIKSNHKIIVAAKTLYFDIKSYIEGKAVMTGSVNNYITQHLSLYTKIQNYIIKDYTEVTYTLLKPGLEFTIFETLNNRGQNLNAYDLTRNILLNISTKEHINMKANTLSIFDKKIRINCRKNNRFNAGFADRLILSCWNMSNEGKISSGKYMKSFTSFVKKQPLREINGQEQRIDEGGFNRASPGALERFTKYLTKLKKCSVFLAELEEPEKLSNRLPLNSVTKRLISRMKLFKRTSFKQHYPMYFALGYKDASAELILKIHKLIESTYVNFILLGKRSPSLIESFFSNMAYKIYTSDALDGLFNHIKSQIINLASEKTVDLENFEELFSSLEVTSNSISHYLLRNIAVNQQSNTEIDLLHDDLTLEHIMPEEWEEHWNTENIFLKKYDDKGDLKRYKLDSKIHSEYINRLGNHTLLLLAPNIEISNKPFDTKLITYSEQVLKITNDSNDHAANHYSCWDAASIEARQKSLSKISKQIWGIIG